MRRVLAILLVLSAAVAAYATYYFVIEFPQRKLKIRQAESYTLEVRPGSSLLKSLSVLEQDGLIKYPRIITLYARLFDQTHIKRGEYLFKRGDTVADMLSKLNLGLVTYRSITLIEGWNLRQTLTEFNSVFGEQVDIQKLAGKIGIDGSLEGWIFPDTYYYSRGDDTERLIVQAVGKMQSALAREWRLRDSGLPYESPYEMLIMASLIEKETAVDAEREQIASVFINRLRKKMKLQTDPTVIYAMGESYDGNIRRRDLKLESPYNTYFVKGLPPTPIAMPSLRSLQAAAKPASSPYLFFVAKGNGEHQFSVTLDEHNAAVDRYQRYSRAENYKSVPDK